jgi:VanZ family protein
MMLIIFAASSTPGKVLVAVGFTKESYHVDAHFSFYFILGMCYYHATKSVWKSIVLTFLYGVSDEFHQLFVPLRSANIWDVFVDTLGGTLATVIIWMLPLKQLKKLENWLAK